MWRPPILSTKATGKLNKYRVFDCYWRWQPYWIWMVFVCSCCLYCKYRSYCQCNILVLVFVLYMSCACYCIVYCYSDWWPCPKVGISHQRVPQHVDLVCPSSLSFYHPHLCPNDLVLWSKVSISYSIRYNKFDVRPLFLRHPNFSSWRWWFALMCFLDTLR